MSDATTNWAAALAEVWGIRATLEPLPGEFDLNLDLDVPAFLRRNEG